MRSWSADNHPTFPGPRFATSSFIEYGRSAGVDSSDQYIYAVSNDGFWGCGNDMILGRVLKLKMASLNGADWEYFRGGDGMKSSAWAPHFNDAKPRRPIGTSRLRLRGGEMSITRRRFLKTSAGAGATMAGARFFTGAAVGRRSAGFAAR